MLNIIIDPIVKVGLSLLASLFSERVLAVGIVTFAEKLAKKTSNLVDDKLVAVWKEELIQKGVKL